jgi:hypothetical protein
MPIKAKIDVTKILKQYLFEGKKGKYLDIVLFETPEDQYGNDYRVSQDLPKEARDTGERGPILGNGKVFGQKQERQPERKAPPQRGKETISTDLPESEDDIPFGG